MASFGTKGLPAWLYCLKQSTKQSKGIFAITGPSGVNVSTLDGKRKRAKPDSLSLLLAGFINNIASRGRNVSIGIPPLARHIPLLLAVSAILENALNKSLDMGVLIVSPDLDLRSRYCDLFISDYALDRARPGSRLKPNGEKVFLQINNNEADRKGVCFFLSGLDLPEKIDFEPNIIILDLRFGRWTNRAKSLTEWISGIHLNKSVIALYTIGDEETLGILNDSKYIDIPLDHQAILTSSEKFGDNSEVYDEQVTVDWFLGNAPQSLIRSHEVIDIQESEEISEIINRVKKELDLHRFSSEQELNRAKWLIAALIHLPVPMLWYEKAAQSMGRSSLKRLIKNLGVRSSVDNLGPVFQSLKMHMQKLYDCLLEENPRSKKLIALITSLSQSLGNESLLILVRDKTTEAALKNWLEIEAFPGSEVLSKIVIKSFPSFHTEAHLRFKVAIINGAFPRRYRWIAGAPLAVKVIFLAMNYEPEVIEHQLHRIYGQVAREVRAKKRADSIKLMLPHIRTSKDYPDSIISGLKIKHINKHPQGSSSQKKEITLNNGFAGLAGAISMLQRQEEEKTEISAKSWENWDLDAELEDNNTSDTITSQSEEDLIPCILIKGRSQALGQGMFYLVESEVLDCIRPSLPNDILRAVPTELRKGDILLRIDDGERMNLFDRVLTIANNQVRYRKLADYRKFWREAIQSLVSKYHWGYEVKYKEILMALQKKGAKIESEAAVRSWITDQVIGPKDITSIVAVGRLSGYNCLENEAKDFAASFQQIRTLRQQTGRRINQLIKKSFNHLLSGGTAQLTMPMEKLESQIALPLDELIETMDLFQVEEVALVSKLIAPQKVNCFHKALENDYAV